MAKKIVETPLMKQYQEMKKKHPDAILLFRVGDFYETFSDDAIDASNILGITLTRRANGSASSVELAGFPHHALDTYLPKLVRAGRRVAICEQLEDPKTTKKLVKRGIIELITPGVNTNDSTISSAENNFLAGVHFESSRGGRCTTVGIAFLDITTGEFLCTQDSPENVDKLIAAVKPRELIRMRGTREICSALLNIRCAVNELDDWVYTPESGRTRLQKQFSTSSLKGFGVDRMQAAVIAAGSLLHYLDYTSHSGLSHISRLGRIDSGEFMVLDRFTLRNLEILEPMDHEAGRSLFDILNHTRTPMGARLLRSWLSFPLLDIARIRSRQDCVEYFFRDTGSRCRIEEELAPMGDLGRLIGRLGNRRSGPREMFSLGGALAHAIVIRSILKEANCDALDALADSMPDLSDAVVRIRSTIHHDAPATTNTPGFIASGVDPELDELRNILTHSRQMMAEMCRREQEATGIASLKISYNNVFGYYYEVRNTHKDKVPADWIRKQTLVNAERYVTEELKEFENKVLTAEGRITEIERRIFNDLVEGLQDSVPAMQALSSGCASADVFLSMASVAEDYRYVRPVVNDSLSIHIEDGRHPVIERRLPPGEPYIANSVELDCDKVQIMMITGPNMSGKSALLRQTALIALMAQTGSFIPAASAEIGIVDKIFSRVGASDNLSSGESTFMMEMNEAASILNNMSQRSLVLFDELGRGTSTYDGISIAWSVVEHIHENGRCRPKTLFATHYHELNEMEKSFSRIANFNVSVSEVKGKIVFLRKLCRGGSEHSFGIHVAKLAGMPPSIVKRADQILTKLEASADRDSLSGGKQGEKGTPEKTLSEIASSREGYQWSLFQLDDPLLSSIRDALLKVDIDRLTPLEALTKLHDLQSLLTGK